MLQRYTSIIAITVLFCAIARGAVITVPTDYPTIQAAIDAAVDGNTVVISPGTYKGTGNVNLTYHGKAITVRSTVPDDPNVVAATIIDCESVSNRRGFTFNSGEGSGSVLSGITVLNGVYYTTSPSWTGSGYVSGFGVCCVNSSPRIEKCVFKSTTTTLNGHAACFVNSHAVMTGCTINNAVSMGIHVEGGGVLIEKCIIKGHRGVALSSYQGIVDLNDCVLADNYTTGGYIIRAGGGTTATFNNCTVLKSGCFDVREGSTLAFNNCILGRLGGTTTKAVDLTYTGAKVTFNYCGMHWGAESVIAPAPAVVEWGPDNFSIGADVGFDTGYRLKFSSICVNKGDPNYVLSPGQTDLYGQPRIIGGRIDVGATEAALAIELIAPREGDILACGSARDIRWAGSAATVNVYYSSTGGTTWSTVATDQPNTGSYRASVPRRASANCMIAVEGVDGTDVVRAESGIFEVRPYMAGAPQDGPWKSIGGDYHRRGLSNFAGPITGCAKWTFETFEPVNNGVAVGEDGTVYVACDSGIVYAVDPDGWMIWGIDLETGITNSPSIGRDGSIYVGCESGEIIALSYDGNIRWTSRTGGMVMAAAAVDDAGRVFAASTDGKVYGLGADGSDLWQWQSPHTSGSSAVVASPTIGADGSVLVCDAYWPVLYSLDAETGSALWQTDYTLEVPAHVTVNGVVVHVPGILGRLMAAPAVGPDGTIYAMFEGYTKLYALESSGVRKWDVDLANKTSGAFAPYAGTISGYPLLVQGSAWSEAVVGPDGTIYVSMDDPYIRAVEPNGVIKWILRCGMQGGFKLTAGSDGYIYACGDEGSLYVVEPDGTIASVFDTDGWMSYPVIASDGAVYMSDSRGFIRALGRQCGEGEMPALRRLADAIAPRGVNFVDYAKTLNDWMKTTWDYKGIYASNPSSPKVITGVRFLATDANRDAYVDIKDIAVIAEQWLEE